MTLLLGKIKLPRLGFAEAAEMQTLCRRRAGWGVGGGGPSLSGSGPARRLPSRVGQGHLSRLWQAGRQSGLAWGSGAAGAAPVRGCAPELPRGAMLSGVPTFPRPVPQPIGGALANGKPESRGLGRPPVTLGVGVGGAFLTP